MFVHHREVVHPAYRRLRVDLPKLVTYGRLRVDLPNLYMTYRLGWGLLRGVVELTNSIRAGVQILAKCTLRCRVPTSFPDALNGEVHVWRAGSRRKDTF